MAMGFYPALAQEDQGYVDYMSKKKKPEPTLNYGQIFMEESRLNQSAFMEVSVFMGKTLASSFVSSLSGGAELAFRLKPYLYTGLEFIVYSSGLSKDGQVAKREMSSRGNTMKIKDIYLRKWALNLNGHLNILTSHINIASLMRVNMSLPIHFGFGITRTKKNKTWPAAQWGAGPKVQFSRRFGVKAWFSQMLTMGGEKKAVFHHLGGSLIFSF